MYMNFLHIGHEIVHLLNDLIALLDRTRAENPQYRLILGPTR